MLLENGPIFQFEYASIFSVFEFISTYKALLIMVFDFF